jgi:hypothetical protein
MTGILEVSFNSPQCGWMSIGFDDGRNEYHTTTAHAPHVGALAELLETLVKLVENENYAHTVQWNRDPEEFDFVFARNGADTVLEIIEYPTGERISGPHGKVFAHRGDAKQIAEAFYETFRQLYEERNVDEFEDNWHQEFPFEEFGKLKETLKKS